MEVEAGDLPSRGRAVPRLPLPPARRLVSLAGEGGELRVCLGLAPVPALLPLLLELAQQRLALSWGVVTQRLLVQDHRGVARQQHL